MKYEKFYITDNKGNSNCVIRTISKLFNEDYEEVENKLLEIANKLNKNYNDIEVFERVLFDNGYYEIKTSEVQIKELKLDSSKYAILCYDKNNYYHMVAVINNILYDRTDESLDLYALKIYKQE